MITELRLKSPDAGGTFDQPVYNFHSAQVTARLNEVGIGDFVLPIAYLDYVAYQGTIEVWRRCNLLNFGEKYLFGNTVHFIDWWLPKPNTAQLLVKTKEAKMLANWRVVAQFSGAGNGASYSAVYGDDLIKTILTNAETNTLFPSDFNRSYATYLAIEAASSAGGVTLDKDFAWTKDVLHLFSEISDLSVEKGGNRIFFDIIKEYGSGSQFLKAVTYVNQIGLDRSGADLSTAPVVLSEANQNLTDIAVSYDYTSAAAVAYAAGQNTGTSRTIKYDSDATLLALPFMRENIKDARNSGTAAAVQDEATDLLRSSRPRKVMRARVVETPTTVFGYHFNLGDKVKAESTFSYETLSGGRKTVTDVFNCWVEAVSISQNGADAKENLDIMLESVENI